MTKPLPKSLHTVTVLKRLAQHVIDSHRSHPPISVVAAVDRATAILGLWDVPDTYGLRDAAIQQMLATARAYAAKQDAA